MNDLLGPVLLPLAVLRLFWKLVRLGLLTIGTFVEPCNDSLPERLAWIRLEFAKTLLYDGIPEEDRCPQHPDYPGVGEHEMETMWRPSVITGVMGSIGKECERCGATRMGTAFMFQQIEWLGKRGMADRTGSWLAGSWTPEPLSANLPKEGGR